VIVPQVWISNVVVVVESDVVTTPSEPVVLEWEVIVIVPEKRSSQAPLPELVLVLSSSTTCVDVQPVPDVVVVWWSVDPLGCWVGVHIFAIVSPERAARGINPPRLNVPVRS
jgi:hypothetical protein